MDNKHVLKKESKTHLNILLERHQVLDDEIDTLNIRNWLSSQDHLHLCNLKRARLKLKDVIAFLQKPA